MSRTVRTGGGEYSYSCEQPLHESASPMDSPSVSPKEASVIEPNDERS